MPTFKELWTSLSGQITGAARQQPSAVEISPSNVDRGADLGGAFKPHEHYFQVRVNELFLTQQRKWFASIDPMVFVVSEFSYDRKPQEVPCIVGPGMMQKYASKLEKLPQGMLFRDTRVAGVHPYRGGRLSLTVVLCEMQVANHARQLLKVIENASAALDFSTALAAYVKVGSAVLDGFDALMGMGGVQPLAGLRREFDPDANDDFAPGFFALINAPAVNPKTLWVRERQLMIGDSLEVASPYRDADYVLYSVVRPKNDRRSDIEQLPFYALWDRVKSEANRSTEDNWKTAKVNMATLSLALVDSPDLTQPHADELIAEFRERSQVLHRNAKKTADMGAAAGQPVATARQDAARQRALSMLDD